MVRVSLKLFSQSDALRGTGPARRAGGAEVLVVERDPKPWGTTSMSTRLIPAAGTPEQAAQGIEDRPALFAADIQAKAKGPADPAIIDHLAAQSADTVAWQKNITAYP